DEIEKAHPEVFNVLLQILEEGRLTEAKGRTVDFRNTVIIMTSNVGAQLIRREGSVGFKAERDEKANYDSMRVKIMDEVKRTFRPEFLNRIDEIIVFHQLAQEHLNQIVGLMLQRVNDRLLDFDLVIELTDAAKQKIVADGFDVTYGARPLRRAITRLIEDPLSEEMLEERFGEGDTVLVDVEGDPESKESKIVFRKQATREKVAVGTRGAAKKKSGEGESPSLGTVPPPASTEGDGGRSAQTSEDPGAG
ncbi:MAG: AAA family ATPase, partial [Thermaerobacterales bacterium]